MRKMYFLFIFQFLITSSFADTFIVDPNGFADFNNIQEAINASWHGDAVIVRPATYNENIFFNGRAITLTSKDPNDPNIVNTTFITTNSGYSVTFDFGEDSNSILTGFTITGWGIHCYASSPTITMNVVRDCNGDGIYGQYDAAPVISYNTIISNSLISAQGGIVGCHGEIVKNNILDNSNLGIYGCNGIIKNNIINNNDYEGVAYCDGLILNNIVSQNHGPGVQYCDGTIKNNTIIRNGWHGIFRCDAIIINNIIAQNGAWGINGACDNSYNNLWMNYGGNFSGGATAGIGDISVEPLFANPDSNDYHLKSAAGRYDPNTENWVFDDVNSPCIDAGDPCDLIGVEPNPNGGRINIGAYGGTAEASKSPTGIVEPVCVNPPSMDTNGDCKIDFIDFAEFSKQWLTCGLDPQSACWE